MIVIEMKNKPSFISFFCGWVFLIAVMSTILAFFLSKYDHSYAHFTVLKEDFVFSITDKPIIIKYRDQAVANLSDKRTIFLKITHNDINQGQVYLNIIKEDHNFKQLANFEYEEKYGYNITGFNGLINLGEEMVTSLKDWQIKITYIDYYGNAYLNPQLIYN